jgi:hypothetical protein
MMDVNEQEQSLLPSCCCCCCCTYVVAMQALVRRCTVRGVGGLVARRQQVRCVSTLHHSERLAGHATADGTRSFFDRHFSLNDIQLSDHDLDQLDTRLQQQVTRSNWHISRLGFGTNMLPVRANLMTHLHTAITNSINVIDSSPVFSNAEDLIGEALHELVSSKHLERSVRRKQSTRTGIATRQVRAAPHHMSAGSARRRQASALYMRLIDTRQWHCRSLWS